MFTHTYSVGVLKVFCPHPKSNSYNPTHFDDQVPIYCLFSHIQIQQYRTRIINYSTNILIKNFFQLTNRFFSNDTTYFLMPMLSIFLTLLSKFHYGSCTIRLNCLTQPSEDSQKTILEWCLATICSFVYYLKHT